MRVPSRARLCLRSILAPSTSFCGGGWGCVGCVGYIKFWSCQICHKTFCQISNFSFQERRYIEFWSCQIWHYKFLPNFPTFSFLGGASIFGQVIFAIEIFTICLHFVQLYCLDCSANHQKLNIIQKQAFHFMMIWWPFFSYFG